VGSRKITSYGKEATDNIVSGLSATGWTIVSGLALGIDAAAHQAALDNDMIIVDPGTDTGIGNRDINFKGKKITIMGLGLLGRGVGDAEFLEKNGADLIVTDLKSKKN